MAFKQKLFYLHLHLYTISIDTLRAKQVVDGVNRLNAIFELPFRLGKFQSVSNIVQGTFTPTMVRKTMFFIEFYILKATFC